MASQSPKYWSKLPAEISLMILDIVVEDYKFQPSTPYLRAGYACVCREWLPVFEQQNFRRLVLDIDRVQDLEEFTAKHQRRDHLEQIFLRVRLDEYDCSVCKTKEDDETKNTNNGLFSRSLWNLLSVLRQWPVILPSSGRYGRKVYGLELELGAYSPSDCKHTFRDFHLEPSYSYQEIKDLQTDPGEAYRQRNKQPRSFNDQLHGWVDGKRDESVVPVDAKQRLMGTLDFKWGYTSFASYQYPLPKVAGVTSLLMRRQFYRKVSGESLAKLLGSFTDLITFRREGWFDVDAQQQSEFDRGFSNTLLPRTLRNLYLFEESNAILHPPSNAAEYRAQQLLGARLSRASRLLENISVAFLVDAFDFLIEFWPQQNQASDKPETVCWKNLRCLTLTSQILRPNKINRLGIYNLLTAACRAIAFMPKLEVLEIWNATPFEGGDPTKKCRAGVASVFRYEFKGQKPAITFSSNSPWLHRIVTEVLQGEVGACWQTLQRHGYGNPITYTFDKVMGLNRRRTLPKMISRLKLQGHVLHEISLLQMILESPDSPGEDIKQKTQTAGLQEPRGCAYPAGLVETPGIVE